MASLWSLGAVVVLAIPLLAQQPRPATLIPRSANERARQQQANRRLIVNVLVTDSLGNPVRGLKLQDFILLDNHQPQAVTSFRSEEGKTTVALVHVMLVLDALNSSARDLVYERNEIERFLGSNGGRLDYPVSVILLTDAGARAGESSRDGNALIAELKRLPMDVPRRNAVADEGGTVLQGIGRKLYATKEGPGRIQDLNQRFKLSVASLFRMAKQQEDVSGRALMIWIGSGWPPLTGPEFLPDTPELHQNYFANIVDMNTALREGQVTLNSVSTPAVFRDSGIHKNDNQPFLTAVTGASRAESANLALPVLVKQSGGRVLDTDKHLAEEIAACVADADAYYVLSFTAQAAATVDEYHSLEIQGNRPGLTVRTSTGYYGRP